VLVASGSEMESDWAIIGDVGNIGQIDDTSWASLLSRLLGEK
jgi:hypothetical protein